LKKEAEIHGIMKTRNQRNQWDQKDSDKIVKNGAEIERHKNQQDQLVGILFLFYIL